MVGSGFTVAVALVRILSQPFTSTQVAKKLVVAEIDGVVKPAALPRMEPPDTTLYQRVLEQPEDPRITVPVPQRFPAVVVGLEGLDRTVI